MNSFDNKNLVASNAVTASTAPPTTDEQSGIEKSNLESYATHEKLPRTLVEMFDCVVRAHAKPDALNYKINGEWRAIAASEMLERIENIACALYASGVRRGDRVAILSENRPEWTIVDAACQFAGVVDVPIYTTQTPAQVCYILNDSSARVLFIQNKTQFERVGDSINSCGKLERVVFLDEGAAKEFDALTIAELEAQGAQVKADNPSLLENLKRAVEPEDLATIIYTSGTTGDPKGVMLTHDNLVSNLVASAEHLLFRRSDSVLSVLPLSHIFERTAMYMYLYNGMSVFYAESLDKIGDNLREVRPTILIAVPRLFEKIYGRIKDKATEGGKVKLKLLLWAIETGKRAASLELADKPLPAPLKMQYELAKKLVFSKWHEGVGGRMRFFISGGAALPEELALVFAGAGMPILQGYGLTETSPVITTNSLINNRPGTVGKPVRGVEVRIASDGEIESRGANVMRGYFNKPDATREVFTDDGWFKTGDIGEIDSDGYLKITDRKKELFKTSGGKYLAPQAVEARVKRSRYVSQVVLIGNERKFPSALIVPDWEQVKANDELKIVMNMSPEERCDDKRLIGFYEAEVAVQMQDLAQFERVKRIALLPHELTTESGELTPTMKVKRRVIDEKYRAVIERIYAE